MSGFIAFSMHHDVLFILSREKGAATGDRGWVGRLEHGLALLAMSNKWDEYCVMDSDRSDGPTIICTLMESIF